MVASSEPSETAGSRAPTEAPQTPDPAKLMEDVRRALAEFKEYAGYLVSLELDRAKLMAKKAGLFAVLGIAALAIASAMLATGAALLMIGIAGLIGYLVNDFFLGATILGVLLLILLAVGGFVGYRIVTTGAMKALRLKYAERRQRQKQMFGHDIKEVARA